MTNSLRTSDFRVRSLAILVLVSAVAGVPTALWRLGGTYLPDELPSWAQTTAALSGPDTGAVFLGLLVIIGWAAWAVFALSVAVELAAQIGGIPPIRLPGMGSPQQLAGLLVAAVVGIGGAPLLAAPAHAGPPVVAEQPFPELPSVPEPVHETSPTAPAATGPTYTVQRRDTLGRIAARYLGDWTRFEEILDLNRGRLQPDRGMLTDPGLIRPGWVLALPPDATLREARSTASELMVQPGDTLADIAEQHGLSSWKPIFDVNAGELLPGGGRFTDPDLIRPGQLLDVPAEGPSAPAPLPPVDPEPPGEEGSPSAPRPEGPPTAPADPSPVPSPASPESPSQEAEESAADGDDADEDQSPSELAAVLAGSGALLAAGLGTAWLAHRRQRLRRRRPGRRLAPLPRELSDTQMAVTSAASSGQADYVALDRALRELAVLISGDPEGQLPDIVAARLDNNRLELRLYVPADQPPPSPWTSDDTGHWWSRQLHADAGVHGGTARGRLAPFPTLVTIGSARGWRWLLDLERVRELYISGPADRLEDFARHLAAELAVNNWSDLLTVTTVGFGEELVDLAPDRVHSVADLADSRLEDDLREATGRRPEDVLNARLRAVAGDGWMPHIVLVPHPPKAAGEQDGLTAALRDRRERGTLAAVLGTDSTQGTGGWALTLTVDGSLLVPALDLQVLAPQLTAQQARDIATLLAFERDTDDEPMPAAEGDRTWQAHTDAAGALRSDAGVGRSTEPQETSSPPRPRQQRPQAVEPTHATLPHVAGASTFTGTVVRTEGVVTVDRAVAAGLRKRIEDDLEQLDRDLADWWDPGCRRPRLTLFGPVTLRAHGDEAAVIKSGLRRRYEEVVAYLATRPHGATVEEAATALQPARGGKTDPVSSRAYVHRITAGARAWLGTDPSTGHKHLSSGHRGRYTLTNVMVDADLFRELRARASVRGDDGMPDLLSALELVSGPPFAQRPTGYEWLGGLELTLTAAICDVAHLVVTTALADDDLDAARTAVATALLVAPDDENVLLDAMWVAYREGNRAEAETYVARIVDVHDGDDEMDLPMSTAETINRARRHYLGRAS
ncbi:LysM domain-containing protein [Blastococcus aurantiacus]|uniref:LysM domain-containing protein n=1 Tax=Blastococcus aurantiacus TaxID=1550231 RepID=A0A1G7R0T2_9ACTN|nr:LysM peptidoglycan-binding domain-containing protein [Blastococcus aurantiacus]SDG04381.1 LysM domain-containing protein [Blastococcus aurantiacus]